jgi:hypothetical protein
MPTDPQTSLLLDPVDWLSAHFVVAAGIAAFCLWVSLCLIIRVWIVHRRAGFLRKLLWSFGLLIPLFGWLLYSAFFRVPDFTGVECPTEHSRDAGYIGIGSDL